jgi:hypothetical protein
MDEDPVLRSLSAELERDDPALAALLSGHRAHRHSPAWVLLLLPLLVPALLLPTRITLAVLAMLLILSSPVLVCWLCSAVDGPVTPRTD